MRKRSSRGTRVTWLSTRDADAGENVEREPNGLMSPPIARVARIQPFATDVYHDAIAWYLLKLLVPWSGPPATWASSRIAEPRVGENGLSRRSRSNPSESRRVL